jgi:hypothetical protein
MLTPHSIIHGNAGFAYFNKIWGIPGKGVLSPHFSYVSQPADRLYTVGSR